jgi:hypothetical protein
VSILKPHVTARVQETEAGVVVEVASPRRPVAVVLLAGWLAAWVIGLGFVTQQFVQGDGVGRDWAFLIAWAVLWLAAGVAAAGYMAWLIAGLERITLGGGMLAIRRSVGSVGITRTYPLGNVTELRTFGRDVAPVLAAALGLAGRGASGVRFRCGDRVVFFARALDEPAAHALIDVLRAHYAFPGSHGRTSAPAA